MNAMEALQELLRSWKGQRVCLAYSGGVDSVFLLDQLKKCGVSVLAVTFDTFLHPKSDAQNAAKWASLLGAEHRILPVNECEDERILENPRERCYFCKHALFSKLRALAKDEGISVLLDGTNADDLKEYRPGLRALKELDIISPLARCGVTKAMVRQASKEAGLPTAHAPSTPCLATRLPYGTRLTPSLLARVEEGERFLHTFGFHNLRLRTDGQQARIEVDVDALDTVLLHRQEILAGLKALSFSPVTLDLEGFRSGSYDRKEGE